MPRKAHISLKVVRSVEPYDQHINSVQPHHCAFCKMLVETRVVCYVEYLETTSNENNGVSVK